MRFNSGVRTFHRWMSLVFTVLVIVVRVASIRPEPPEWVFYLPLPPPVLMLISGLYLFALPYCPKSRQNPGQEVQHEQ